MDLWIMNILNLRTVWCEAWSIRQNWNIINANARGLRERRWLNSLKALAVSNYLVTSSQNLVNGERFHSQHSIQRSKGVPLVLANKGKIKKQFGRGNTITALLFKKFIITRFAKRVGTKSAFCWTVRSKILKQVDLMRHSGRTKYEL